MKIIKISLILAIVIIVTGCNALGQFAARIGIGRTDATEESAVAPGDTSQASGAGGRPGGAGGGPPQRPVSTSVASVSSRSEVIQVAGRLRPRTRIVHEVPVAGVIRQISVETGDRISTGDVLFTVERDDIGQTFRPVPVEARISGVVSNIDIQTNQQVRVGNPAVAVVGDDGYMLEAHVSDKDASGIREGTAVVAHTVDDVELTGRLAQRSAEPDYESGLFLVTFEFSREQRGGFGSFLIVDLPTSEIKGIFVNRESVDRRYGRHFLWVVDETENALTRREVSLGQVVDGDVVIESGLAEGERYVSRLTGREREGTPVPEAGASARTRGDG